MKQGLLLFTVFICAFSLSGQTDTLLWEDFQDSISNSLEFPDPDSVGTNNWINYDMDFKADANGRPQNWYITTDLVYLTTDTTLHPLDTNYVLGSSSWLQGFENGNRNWFISPPIQIVDDQAMLYWKAAPRQGPRYLDGYSVRVSTTENFPGDYDENNLNNIFGEFTDLLFHASQMIPPLPNGANDVNDDAFQADSFVYEPTNGYIHASGFTNQEYMWADTAGTLYIGLLEPQSASLAAYEGQTIYIAFLHDSDDDNLITIDDILVTGTDPIVSTNAPQQTFITFFTYPNPVDNYLIVNYQLLETVRNIQLDILDMNGRQVQSFSGLNSNPGNHTQRINLTNLPSGSYQVVFTTDKQQLSRTIIRR